jgi:hypothetical protein
MRTNTSADSRAADFSAVSRQESGSVVRINSRPNSKVSIRVPSFLRDVGDPTHLLGAVALSVCPRMRTSQGDTDLGIVPENQDSRLEERDGKYRSRSGPRHGHRLFLRP